MNCHQLSTLFLHGSSLSFPSRKPIEYPDMARKTLMLLLAPALADPDCLKPGLGKDPMLPAPSMYVANWATCAENCAKSLTCQEYSFKSDTAPTSGGCWLFNKADVDVEADPKAVTASKACKAPPAALAAAEAGMNALADGVDGAASAVTGTAQVGVDKVTSGVNTAATAAAGTVQTGLDSVTSGIHGVNANSLTDGINGAAGSAAGALQGHLNGLTNGLTGAANSITGGAQKGGLADGMKWHEGFS